MIFLDNFDIIVIFFAKLAWAVETHSSDGNFDDVELSYLSHKLNPIECLKLLEAMYLKQPIPDDEFMQSETIISLDDESILRRQLEVPPFFNRDNCLNKLQEWSHKLPPKSSKWSRITMEAGLQSLGRPDLAKYVKKNRRAARYMSAIGKISRNTESRGTSSLSPIIAKRVESIPPDRPIDPKEIIIQYYRNPEKAKVFNEPVATPGSLRIASGKNVDEEDSRRRWTAFFVFLGVLSLTILATITFALYKRNKNIPCTGVEKCLNESCSMGGERPESGGNFDVEQAKTVSRCVEKKTRGRRTRRRSSSSSSSSCVREETKPGKKVSKMKGCQRAKEPQPQARRVDRRRRCEKRCTGLLKNCAIKIDKSTRTQEKKISEKCNQSDLPKKPRSELKSFQEKLASILRRDRACRCCKCSAFTGDNVRAKCASSKNKSICMDDRCEKTRLKSIMDLCASRDNETSPVEGTDVKRARSKTGKPKKKKQKMKKISNKENKGVDGDTDKEKESEKSSAENSPRPERSKDRKDTKSKKKHGKAKKEKYNVQEACTRKTCDFGRSANNKETAYID